MPSEIAGGNNRYSVFMIMKRITYKNTWKILENATPIESDCGGLCGRACCKGTGDDGMLLFPGEEAMYPGGEVWYSIKDSNITLSDGTAIKFFTCGGDCERSMRPLSCRIFPILPYIDEFDYLEFVPDLRGAHICPLLYRDAGESISPAFIEALYSAFATLVDDKRVLEFIEILSRQYDALAADCQRFYNK